MKKRGTKEIFVKALFELAKKKPVDKISVKEIVAESEAVVQ